MKNRTLAMFITFVILMNGGFAQRAVGVNDVDVVALSQALLLAAKTKEPTDSLVAAVSAITLRQLTTQLNNDDKKKAFWINLYNAFTQIALAANPGKYKHRGSFFRDEIVQIAGKKLSLDDVEHGLLRRSKIKWSMGYLNKMFPSSFEKQMRVNTVDYRIHFALNCGAKSCPPIAFYSPENLTKQLDLATRAYLAGDAEFDATTNKVVLPAIMGWFRGDFGGKEKMKGLLKSLAIIPERANPSISFAKYNWDIFLENYAAE